MKAPWVKAGGRTPGEIGFCERCGQGLGLQLPVLVTVMVAAMKAFTQAHSRCKEKAELADG